MIYPFYVKNVTCLSLSYSQDVKYPFSTTPKFILYQLIIDTTSTLYRQTFSISQHGISAPTPPISWLFSSVFRTIPSIKPLTVPSRGSTIGAPHTPSTRSKPFFSVVKKYRGKLYCDKVRASRLTVGLSFFVR